MITAKSPHSVQVCAPTSAGHAGGSPRLESPAHAPAHRVYNARTPRSRLAKSAMIGAALALAACANTDANQVTSPIALGMTDSLGAYYSDGQLTIYEVQKPVALPIRRPTDDEVKALGKTDPYPRSPFLLAGDLRVEVRFTLSNLDDASHNVELLLDPWNEFVRYRPGVQVVSDEETTPNFSGYDRLIVVPGKSRVVGTITADDTNELAVDLATAEAIMKNPPPDGQDGSVPIAALFNHVFNLQNRSSAPDPLIDPYIPKVIAGLTGFDLGVRTYEHATVAVEIVIDVTDLNGNRVIPAGDGAKPSGPPGTILQPPSGGTMGN